MSKYTDGVDAKFVLRNVITGNYYCKRDGGFYGLYSCTKFDTYADAEKEVKIACIGKFISIDKIFYSEYKSWNHI